MSIVSAADIRQHGYRTLAEILNTLAGFYVSYDRNYSYVGVRGFDHPGDYSSWVLLMNGLRTNEVTLPCSVQTMGHGTSWQVKA